MIHAHPPHTTARGLANLAIKPALPEAIVSIGDLIPVVPFTMPGDREGEIILAAALNEYDVVMLQGNGILAVGDSIEQAYLRLELAEHLAKTDYYARQLGQPFELSAKDINLLLEKRTSIGLGSKARISSATNSSRAISADIDLLTKIIAEELAKAL